jgi:hypothetical protein
MISRHGRLRAVVMRLRMHSQFAGFVIGLALATFSALLWHRKVVDEIFGSLLVGVSTAVIFAAIFAFLSPFNEPAFLKFLSLGIEDFWDSRDKIDEEDWVDRVHGAKESCTLLGIAHGKWCGDPRFHPTLSERLNHGVMFKMLFLNPESSAAELRATEEKRGKKGRDTRDAIRQSIKKMWEFRQQLEAGPKDRLRLYVYDATPSCGLTWIDQTMIATHYLPGQQDVTSPALLIIPPQAGIKGSLYNVYARIVQDLESNNLSVVIDERNIQQFLPGISPGQPPGDAEPNPPGPTGAKK